MINIAVLISGGGTNLQALIDSQNSGRLKSGRIKLVVSDKEGAYGLQRAENNQIPGIFLDPGLYLDRASYEDALLKLLADHQVEMVVLAGFLRVLGPNFINQYRDRIINIHPSLLPAFSGKGFYGLKVHQAALESGVKTTGASVHFVDETVDGGEIILQKAVTIKPDDSPESLQKRVMEEAEWIILPMAAESVSASLSLEKQNERRKKNETI